MLPLRVIRVDQVASTAEDVDDSADDGRYTWSARYGVATHKLRELTAADRSRRPIDTIVQTEPSGLDLLLGNEMPDTTIHVAWPEALGATGPDLIGYAADGRSLIVSSPSHAIMVAASQ